MFRLPFLQQLIRKPFVLLLLPLMGWLANTPHAYAAGCVVPSVDYATVQTAVNDPQCPRILLETGSYIENITITRNVMIVGAGDQASIIDGNQSGPVITIQPGLTVKLNNLVLQNGNGLFGNGIYNDDSDLTLVAVLLRDNRNSTGGPSRGAGIYNNMGNIILRDSTFLHNGKLAIAGGGIYNNAGTLVIKDSLFQDNGFPTSSGGSIHNEFGLVTIKRSQFNLNFANDGAMIFNNGGVINSKHSSYANGSGVSGAAIFNNGVAEFNSNGDTFADGRAIGRSGGIFNNGGTVDLRNCLFERNVAFGGGGAIHNRGTMTVKQCTFRNNTADMSNGGAIYNNGDLSLKNVEIVENTAVFGGGIANDGTLSLINITYSNNIALADGNDVWNTGSCTGCPS